MGATGMNDLNIFPFSLDRVQSHIKSHILIGLRRALFVNPYNGLPEQIRLHVIKGLS